MIPSFDDPEFIAGKCQALCSLLQNPSVVDAFGIKGAVVDRQRDKVSGEIKWHMLQHSFVEGRKLMPLKQPQTNIDPLVFEILHYYFGVPSQQLELGKVLHLQAMVAENSVGLLLERFIASVLEPHGWIWCSGSTVRAVDFICPQPLLLVQVKNRDNSENSSSSAIREGSQIQKWFRMYSKYYERYNWDQFPLPDQMSALRLQLNEEAFRAFVAQQMQELKMKVMVQTQF